MPIPVAAGASSTSRRERPVTKVVAPRAECPYGVSEAYTSPFNPPPTRSSPVRLSAEEVASQGSRNKALASEAAARTMDKARHAGETPYRTDDAWGPLPRRDTYYTKRSDDFDYDESTLRQSHEVNFATYQENKFNAAAQRNPITHTLGKGGHHPDYDDDGNFIEKRGDACRIDPQDTIPFPFPYAKRLPGYEWGAPPLSRPTPPPTNNTPGLGNNAGLRKYNANQSFGLLRLSQ